MRLFCCLRGRMGRERGAGTVGPPGGGGAVWGFQSGLQAQGLAPTQGARGSGLPWRLRLLGEGRMTFCRGAGGGSC